MGIIKVITQFVNIGMVKCAINGIQSVILERKDEQKCAIVTMHAFRQYLDKPTRNIVRKLAYFTLSFLLIILKLYTILQKLLFSEGL